MTEATVQALNGLRDLSMVKWYIIPLLSIIFYIYTKDIKLARSTGNWDAVFAGLAIFVISLKKMKHKIITLIRIYSVPTIMNIVAFGFLSWNY